MNRLAPGEKAKASFEDLLPLVGTSPTIIPFNSQLVIARYIQTVSANLTAKGVVLTKEGTVVPFASNGSFTTEAGQRTSESIPLPAGLLLGLSIEQALTDNPANDGANFVQAELWVGVGSQQQRVNILARGWPGLGRPVTLGQAQLGNVWERMPYQAAISNPAAGAEWSNSFSGQGIRMLACVCARLVTSATVATRQVGIEVVNGGNGLQWFAIADNTQQASKTADYCFAQFIKDTSDTGTNPRLTSPLPQAAILSGSTLRSRTLNLQAGDQWSNITYQTFAFGNAN